MVWRAIACRALPDITIDSGAQKMGKLFAIREKRFHIPKDNRRMWDITDRVMKGLTILRCVIDAGFRANSPARVEGTFNLGIFMDSVAQQLFVCSEDVSQAFALRFSTYFPEGLPVFAYAAGVAARCISAGADRSAADRAAGEIMHGALAKRQPLAPVVSERAIVPARKRKINDDLEIIEGATGIQAVAQNTYAAVDTRTRTNAAALLSEELSDEEINDHVREYEAEAVRLMTELAAKKDAHAAAGTRVNPQYLTAGGRTDYRYVVIAGSVETVAKIIFDANADLHAGRGDLDLLPPVAIAHFITEGREFASRAYDATGPVAGSPKERIQAVRVIAGEAPCVAFSVEFITQIGKYTQVRRERERERKGSGELTYGI